MDSGSKFESFGPETAKHLWPYHVVLERGTARSALDSRLPMLYTSWEDVHLKALDRD